MKEVLINGVTYLPASQLAKEFRYTTDYIGQLCRSKKVDAQLVGRSWYVNPESLRSLRQKRYSRPTKTTQSDKKEVRELKPVLVDSPLAKATVKMHATPQSTNFSKRIEWKPVRYEGDEAPLLPSLNKQSSPVSLKVNLADSTDISIKTSTKSTLMVADEMPSVVLKGRLKVSSLEEIYETEDLDEPGYINNSLTKPKVQKPVPVVEQKINKEAHDSEPLVKIRQKPAPAITVNEFTPVTISSAPNPDGFNLLEWGLVVANLALAIALMGVIFASSSVFVSSEGLVEIFNFEHESFRALLGQFLH